MTTTITALTKAKNTLAGLVTSTCLELESKTLNFLRCLDCNLHFERRKFGKYQNQNNVDK